MSTAHERPTNRLQHETSPYLLQHAHNPVDWYPWGKEALERAKAEDKPIFLSIGYSACHWCHVMERECFENEAIAAIMNEHFINIKVDREERPDLDQIYMAAVQALTGHGGWPMSVFLTPDLQPFFGGTYYPPEDRHGMPGFPRVLQGVARAWKERPKDIRESASRLTEHLGALRRLPAGEGGLQASLLDDAAKALARTYESRYGGFGNAPKFPHTMDLQLLLRIHARNDDDHALHMVRHTLDHMARGGIYDHLGGGFARYSTDDRWLVPHFEKMLYDNALLAQVYVESYQVTHEVHDARIARETIDYVLGRMTSPEGGFYSAEDADSEGVEGKYYVWSLEEVKAILGEERGKTFAYVYDVTERGNWEGHNILNLTKPVDQAAKMLGREPAELEAELAESRAKLLAAREKRVPPGKDTKVLAAWNGLMMAALARAGRALPEPRYLEAAERNAAFILDHMRQPDGRLWRSFAADRAKINAYLEDHAAVIDGLTRLFEATGNPRWITEAITLADVMRNEFSDRVAGGFFETGERHEELIVRPKELLDQSTPSGNALAATALLRLGALTGREDFTEDGRRALEAVEAVMRQYPTAAAQSLIALDFYLTPTTQYAVIAGTERAEFEGVLNEIARRFEPAAVVAPAPAPVSTDLARLVPLLADRPAREGRVTTYVCRNFTCKEPIVGPLRL